MFFPYESIILIDYIKPLTFQQEQPKGVRASYNLQIKTLSRTQVPPRGHGNPEEHHPWIHRECRWGGEGPLKRQERVPLLLLRRKSWILTVGLRLQQCAFSLRDNGPGLQGMALPLHHCPSSLFHQSGVGKNTRDFEIRCQKPSVS